MWSSTFQILMYIGINWLSCVNPGSDSLGQWWYLRFCKANECSGIENRGGMRTYRLRET